MLNEIGDWLETNIRAALGVPTLADGFRTVQQGEEYPPAAYPYLYIVAGPFRAEVAEFGDGDGVYDRLYRFNLAGAVYATSRANALAGLETQTKRLERWCVATNGMGGLSDGTESVFESLPGPVEPQIQGSGEQWIGYFLVPLNIKTTGAS